MNFDPRNNDFWTPLTRDNYDRWKLASPDDYQDAHHQEQLDQEEQDQDQ
jgi:hypothetical protein